MTAPFYFVPHNESFKRVKSLYSFKDMFWYVAGAYVLAGAFIGAVGTSISTGKHLKV